MPFVNAPFTFAGDPADVRDTAKFTAAWCDTGRTGGRHCLNDSNQGKEGQRYGCITAALTG